MRATKIKMKPGHGFSYDLVEIDKIYLEGCQENGFYAKESVYDYLKGHPNSIQVNIYPYPNLQPMLSQNREKYVRSQPDYTGKDNLLRLPRE